MLSQSASLSQVVRAVTSTTLHEMADRYYDASRPALPRKVTGKIVHAWSVCTWSRVNDRQVFTTSKDRSEQWWGTS